MKKISKKEKEAIERFIMYATRRDGQEQFDLLDRLYQLPSK